MRSNGKDVFYRTTNDTAVLKLVDRDIALLLNKQKTGPTKFNARTAVIVTYNNVVAYSSSSYRFKYQVVIATDYKHTYTIMNYHRLDLSTRGSSGFYERSSCKINTDVFTNSSDRTVLTSTSNVGIPGKHVYLLSDDVDSCLNQGGKSSCTFYKNFINTLCRLVY